MPTRRDLIVSAASALVGMTVHPSTQNPALESERQKGDPEDDYETVTYDPAQISTLSNMSGRATFESWQRGLPAAMLTTARTFIGHSRTTTPAQIAEFLQLFYLDLKDKKGVYVPYCAAGISFCALLAFAQAAGKPLPAKQKLTVLRTLAADIDHYYFYPTVSCRDMMNIAEGRRRWISRNAQPRIIPKTGWIVLFDWEKGGNPSHCGIVQNATDSKVFTVEFNTSVTAAGNQRNGGVVAAKERQYDYIVGFISTDQAPPAV
jgi:hypothetical protein